MAWDAPLGFVNLLEPGVRTPGFEALLLAQGQERLLGREEI